MRSEGVKSSNYLALTPHNVTCSFRPRRISYNPAMAHLNDHYLKLKAGYLFPEIGRRVKIFSETNPNSRIIRMGIGDVTEPLPQACIEAMHKAVDDMARRESFHGYGPEQGYEWLRDAIAK